MDLSKEWYKSEFINHENTEIHRQLEIELEFYNAIANGDIEKVQENCNEQAFMQPEGMGKLSENPLQNIKFHFVVTSAMVTRYCIQTGMEQEKAYSLSDFYILKMDKCKTIEEVADLHNVMCLDFCKQMYALRKAQVLSKPIVLCLDYIYSHVHYRITIAELAAHLEISESYLSKLFHKELGVTISEYILGLKIEKAKNMLRFSNYSIVEIANYLSFSSQSHFIQVFQKYVGLTPHKYRIQHFHAEWEKMNSPTKLE